MESKQVIRDSKRIIRFVLSFFLLFILGLILSSCAADDAPVPTEIEFTSEPDQTIEPLPTTEPVVTTEPYPTTEPLITEEPFTSPILIPEPVEYWMVDLEWPSSIFLGESDVIRLTLTPSESEIIIELEFSDHEKARKFEKYLKSGSGRAFAKKRFWD